jgi:hypothetical protein
MYLSQGVDYLGFLNAKLRDLEGWSTLANELIQNAGDAAAAVRISNMLSDDIHLVSAVSSSLGFILAHTGNRGLLKDHMAPYSLLLT